MCPYYILSIAAFSQTYIKMNVIVSRGGSAETNPTLKLTIPHYTAKNTLTPLWVKVYKKSYVLFII